MVKVDYEMNTVLAGIFIAMVHERNLPVHAEVGVPYVDSNGDCMVAVTLLYDDKAGGLVSKYLSSAMNLAAEVLNNREVAV